MKKLFSLTTLILFVLALSTVRCKKDKTTEELLAGRWNLSSQKITEYINDVKESENTETYDEGERYIEFSEDGTGEIYEDGDLLNTFTWELDGDTISISPEGDDPFEGEFILNGNLLTIKITYEETLDGDVYKTEVVMLLNRD